MHFPKYFEAVAWCVYAAVLCCGLAGVFLATRGRWLGLVLVLPALLIGGVLTMTARADRSSTASVVFLAPLVIGAAGAVVWAVRRRSNAAPREGPRTPEETL